MHISIFYNLWIGVYIWTLGGEKFVDFWIDEPNGGVPIVGRRYWCIFSLNSWMSVQGRSSSLQDVL